MSRGFRDADDTQEASARETGEVVERMRSAGDDQRQRALERQAQGSYGICETCGRPIAPERLDAVPEATRCVACQSGWEAAGGAAAGA